jgi:Zn-finger nucleic acid-binding protein
MNDGLTCPKCQGTMRSYERNGVTVDQCSDCRGIFLDRGELERLTEAEGAYYAERKPEPQRAEHREERHEKPYRKKKKESFFSELFE